MEPATMLLLRIGEFCPATIRCSSIRDSLNVTAPGRGAAILGAQHRKSRIDVATSIVFPYNSSENQMLTHGRYLIGPPPNHGSRTAATDSGVNVRHAMSRMPRIARR